MTADAAVQGIRQVDAAGSIGLLSAEVHAPYDRPPLTKGLWKGKPLAAIWRGGGSGGDALSGPLGTAVGPGPAPRNRRPGSDLPVPEAAAGHRRLAPAIATGGRFRLGPLLSHAGRLSAAAGAGRPTAALCRRGGRVHRLRDRRRSGHEREGRGYGLSRPGDRVRHVPARLGGVCYRLLSQPGRGGPHGGRGRRNRDPHQRLPAENPRRRPDAGA